MCKAVVPRLKPWATLAAVAWLLSSNEISAVLTSERDVARRGGRRNRKYSTTASQRSATAKGSLLRTEQELTHRYLHTCAWQFL